MFICIQLFSVSRSKFLVLKVPRTLPPCASRINKLLRNQIKLELSLLGYIGHGVGSNCCHENFVLFHVPKITYVFILLRFDDIPQELEGKPEIYFDREDAFPHSVHVESDDCDGNFGHDLESMEVNL